MSHESQSSLPASTKTTRRGFTKILAATAFATQFGATFIPAHAFGKMEKPALAGIGAGGKGQTDIVQSRAVGFDVAALVDVVDAPKLQKIDNKKLKSILAVREAFPKARFFADYREMFSEMGDKIDAVTVSTPDHHHFHASLMAMQTGKHVYCQKPLTHSIHEARMLAKVAAETGVKTQMGNQAHANDHMRDCVEFIQAGIVGKVKEIHAWTNRPIWAQGFATPPEGQPVPDAINWEQWIGPAAWVDYSPKIAPFQWRGWWDYGTGALGDMACHIMDMGYWAMGLPTPKSVTAEQHGATKLSPPINSKITWDFAANPYSAADGFQFKWYDGYIDAEFDSESWALKKNVDEYNHPSADVLDGESFKDYGSVIIGEKGKLFFNRSRKWIVKPSTLADDFVKPEPKIHRAGGNNYAEWLDAITGKIEQSQSYFGQSGPLTETVLLGVLAQRYPDTVLEWNHEAMQIAGRDDLQRHIQHNYPTGWEVKV
jgi:predicted dehydrogenase